MESSSEQALLIGVSVFILIIALTCAIMLMVTVLNISNAANSNIKTGTDSSLMTLYGGTNERVYSGEQVLAVLEEYNSPTTNMRENIVLKLVAGGKTFEDINKDFVEESFDITKVNSNYHLNYEGKSGSKDVYIFEEIK